MQETFFQELFLFQKPCSKLWCDVSGLFNKYKNNNKNISPPLLQYSAVSIAKFIVPDWGIKSTMA